MSDLTFLEKHKLEKLFGMGSGYILDFSNNSLSAFVADSTGRNIYDARYDRSSGSKANRVRAFWSVEPNHLAGKLIARPLGVLKDQWPGQERADAFCGLLRDRDAAKLRGSSSRTPGDHSQC